MEENGQKKNIVEVACRRALPKRSAVAAAGKYLWSCHGTRPRLRILFKQSLSEPRQGGGDTIITAPMRALVTTPRSRLTVEPRRHSEAPLKIAEQGVFGE